MKNSNFVLAAIVAGSLISFTAIAQPASGENCQPGEHHHRFKGPDGEGGDFKFRQDFKDRFPAEKKLNLTDDQKKILADARNAEEPARKELHQKLRAAHEALRNAGDSNADDATLTRLAKDVSDLVAQQELARIKMHRQFVSVLTPEQKQKLDAFKAEFKNVPHKREHRKEKQQ
jgi:Spy/CpxP family protein refolding chaperone